MNKPLKGIRVVEVAMWAFVPSAGAVLSDMGAEVVKIEAPAGDPIRALNAGGIAPGTGGFTFMWEIFNRGKRSVAIEPATVSADRMQLFHLLLNLVSNSLKFYAAGTEPYVEIRTSRSADGAVHLVVRDRGIGFEQAAADTVFEPFRRLNARSAYAGSGLGLAIVQSIVERHGWSCDVTTAPGAGSAFEIVVPAADVVG